MVRENYIITPDKDKHTPQKALKLGKNNVLHAVELEPLVRGIEGIPEE